MVEVIEVVMVIAEEVQVLEIPEDMEASELTNEAVLISMIAAVLASKSEP